MNQGPTIMYITEAIVAIQRGDALFSLIGHTRAEHCRKRMTALLLASLWCS